MKDSCQEKLLKAWMNLALQVRGNRILEDLSMTEMVVCSLLFQRQQSGGEPMTAAELCAQTRLLKSQINRLLEDMERKGLIRRQRSTEDRRKVYVFMRKEQLPRYLKEHSRIIELMTAVTEGLGEEKSEQLTEMIYEAIGLVDRFLEADEKAG